MLNLECKTDKERQRLVQNVRRWGDVNTDAILDRSCQIFGVPEIDGLIGYKVELGYAVVFGDPVCAPADQIPLAQAFKTFCQKEDLKIIYVMTSDQFSNIALGEICQIGIEFGDKLLLDTKSKPTDRTGPKAILIRKKVKKALKESVEVLEYEHSDPKLENAIEQVAQEWVKSRQGPQVHIAGITLFADRLGKRWFYAKKDEKIVGVLVLNHLQSQNGWLLNNVMLMPDAPGGTSELLVSTAMDALYAENYDHVVIGPIPALELNNIVGVGPFSQWMARTLYSLAKKIFRLDGHRAFWDKFQSEKHRSYLLFDQSHLSIKAVRALMRSMNAPL